MYTNTNVGACASLDMYTYSVFLMQYVSHLLDYLLLVRMKWNQRFNFRKGGMLQAVRCVLCVWIILLFRVSLRSMLRECVVCWSWCCCLWTQISSFWFMMYGVRRDRLTVNCDVMNFWKVVAARVEIERGRRKGVFFSALSHGEYPQSTLVTVAFYSRWPSNFQPHR